MQFQESFVVQKQSCGGGSHGMTTPDVVTITTNKGGSSRVQLTIRIGERVMKSMRWLSGDRIEVVCGVHDGKKAVLLRRSAAGFTLSSQQGNKLKGKCVRSSLKMNMTKELQNHFASMLDKNFVPEVSEEFLIVS